MTNKQIIAAIGMALMTVPASAGTAAAAAAVKSSKDTAAKETKYCTKEANTGTRLESKDCRTKAEWAREGINIEEFTKKRQ